MKAHKQRQSATDFMPTEDVLPTSPHTFLVNGGPEVPGDLGLFSPCINFVLYLFAIVDYHLQRLLCMQKHCSFDKIVVACFKKNGEVS